MGWATGAGWAAGAPVGAGVPGCWARARGPTTRAARAAARRVIFIDSCPQRPGLWPGRVIGGRIIPLWSQSGAPWVGGRNQTRRSGDSRPQRIESDVPLLEARVGLADVGVHQGLLLIGIQQRHDPEEQGPPLFGGRLALSFLDEVRDHVPDFRLLFGSQAHL